MAQEKENPEAPETEAPEQLTEEEVTSGDSLADGAVEESEKLPGDQPA